MREAAAAMITRPELKCAPSAACPQANTSLGKSSRLRRLNLKLEKIFGGWQPDVMVVGTGRGAPPDNALGVSRCNQNQQEKGKTMMIVVERHHQRRWWHYLIPVLLLLFFLTERSVERPLSSQFLRCTAKRKRDCDFWGALYSLGLVWHS